MDEGGSGDRASLRRGSVEGASGRGRASSLGTLEDMVGKSPNTDISLYRGPVITEGKVVAGEGGSYTSDFEKWMKEGSRNGASLCEGFHEGNLEAGLLFWGTQRYVKQGSEMDFCLNRGPAFVEH
jgi:hypothetical protein